MKHQPPELASDSESSAFAFLSFPWKHFSPFWTFQAFGWGAYAVVLLVSNLPYLRARGVIAYRAVAFVACFAASFLLHNVCRRPWQAGLRFPRSFLVVLAWCGGLAYVCAALAFIAEQVCTRDSDNNFIVERAWENLGAIINVIVNLAGTISAGLILLAWCALYFGVKYYEALQTEKERALTAENTAREAQLEALRYQIHPHFLFNTLNAISTLVLEGESEAATSMIARLADFFRATLDGRIANETTLREELYVTEQYLEIEKLRLGDRLQVTIDIDSSVAHCLVPHFLLQPVVENAIRHGIAPSGSLGHLAIKGEKVQNKLLLNVKDNGVGRKRSDLKANAMGPRVGLTNIRKRLHQLYGSAAQCELRWPNNGGCEVTLKIPYRTQPDSRYEVYEAHSSHS